MKTETKAQHTPGPWVVSNAGHKLFIHSETPDTICEIEEGMYSNDSISAGVLHANARLIAAAPELLAAANKAMDECVDLIATPAGDALQAAISKAEAGK